jgi:hypothetical protein
VGDTLIQCHRKSKTVLQQQFETKLEPTPFSYPSGFITNQISALIKNATAGGLNLAFCDRQYSFFKIS